MATYIKFNNSDVLYPASITGRLNDSDWDNRASKAINVEMPYDEAISMFVDEVEWSIVQDIENMVDVFDEETQRTISKYVIEQEVYDNSEYSILGDITVHKDGTVTVKMGKPTAEEILAILLGEA